jgi:hypothetical protein
MASKKSVTTHRRTAQRSAGIETDSSYFLKLVLYLIVGSVWIRLDAPIEVFNFTLTALPVGLVVGLLFASHDHFQIDRKIEYAVLVLVTIASYFLPTGIIL